MAKLYIKEGDCEWRLSYPISLISVLYTYSSFLTIPSFLIQRFFCVRNWMKFLFSTKLNITHIFQNFERWSFITTYFVCQFFRKISRIFESTIFWLKFHLPIKIYYITYVVCQSVRRRYRLRIYSVAFLDRKLKYLVKILLWLIWSVSPLVILRRTWDF